MLKRFPNVARAVACWLLLSFGGSALAGAATRLGQVLCFGEDGHLAVELARGSDCTHEFATAYGSGASATGEDAHCGQCVDVEISSAKATGTAKCTDSGKPRSQDAPLFTLHACLWSVPAPSSAAAARCPVSDLPNPVLLARRTVVLLV